MDILDLTSTIAQDAFWSALAALGFAILFQAPPAMLPGCAFSGALGHATRTLLMELFGVPIEIATLGGATVIGFFSTYLSMRWRTPAIIFSVTGAIPMVPGFLAYSAMLGIIQLTVQGDAASVTVLMDTVVNGIRTGLILGALALGLTLPRLLLFRAKPVV